MDGEVDIACVRPIDFVTTSVGGGDGLGLHGRGAGALEHAFPVLRDRPSSCWWELLCAVDVAGYCPWLVGFVGLWK